MIGQRKDKLDQVVAKTLQTELEAVLSKDAATRIAERTAAVVVVEVRQLLKRQLASSVLGGEEEDFGL